MRFDYITEDGKTISFDTMTGERIVTSEENLKDLKAACELLARRERLRLIDLAKAIAANYRELNELEKDKEDEKDGDWTR